MVVSVLQTLFWVIYKYLDLYLLSCALRYNSNISIQQERELLFALCTCVQVQTRHFILYPAHNYTVFYFLLLLLLVTADLRLSLQYPSISHSASALSLSYLCKHRLWISAHKFFFYILRYSLLTSIIMPNWKSYESAIRLLSAVLAADPDRKLNYQGMF